MAGGRRARFYALETIGGMEERVAVVLAQRAVAKNLDVKSIVVPSDLKGLVIVEVSRLADLIDLTAGVRNLKRKRPIPVKPEEVEAIVKPAVEAPTLSVGDIVEVVAGAFKGRRGRVIEVSKNEVKIQVLDAGYGMIATVGIDEVRKVEE